MKVNDQNRRIGELNALVKELRESPTEANERAQTAEFKCAETRENVPLAHFSPDTHWHIEKANTANYALWGRGKQILGNNYRSLFGYRTAPPSLQRKKYVEAFEKGKTSDFEALSPAVDDEGLVAQTAKDALSSLGYEVKTETERTLALKTFAERDNFDPVITDQTLSGMSGINLAKRLLKSKPGTPIVLRTLQRNCEREDREGVVIRELLMKPYTRAGLSRVADRVLKRRAGLV
jgi:CheY-like chemotaxis protein